jgi:hypothetical protein
MSVERRVVDDGRMTKPSRTCGSGVSVVVQPSELLDYLRGTKIRVGGVRPGGNTELRMMIARYRHEPNVFLARRIVAEAEGHSSAEVRAIAQVIQAQIS